MFLRTTPAAPLWAAFFLRGNPVTVYQLLGLIGDFRLVQQIGSGCSQIGEAA
jgi:hypothetical protein